VTKRPADIPFSDWTPVQLRKMSAKATQHLKIYVERISTAAITDSREDALSEIEFLQRSAVRSNPLNRSSGRGDLDSYIMVISDLAKQGWRFRYQKTLEYKKVLPTETADKGLAQSLKQGSSQAARYNNLLQPSIQDRIRKLETSRFYKGRSISIFSLMRDGRELSHALRNWAASSGDDIRDVIDPYFQVVTSADKCQHTGLHLMDIWWYFRQTWGIPHESTAGRSLPFLIRDAATENHTVIGISALSSPVAQHSVRDQFIGWDTEQVLADIAERASARLCRWINARLNEEVNLVYRADLIEKKIITAQSVRRPTPAVIETLKDLARREKALHQTSSSQTIVKSSTTDLEDNETWRHEATTHLFTSKRALLLSQLLDCRLTLNEFSLDRNSKSALKAAISTAAGRKAIGRVIRLQKERTVGTAIAEISVCGAIEPYSSILGGKLVSLLMTSHEVLSAYKKRYSGQVNVIASSMAAKAIKKPADLVFLSTTSLYGRPNQYTRASVPLQALSDQSPAGTLKYHYLGKTGGTGSLHFSKRTIETFKQAQRDRGEPITVTGQFGEGGSEKLRYLRDRLNWLGLDPDDLLEHGVPRSYYGIKFIANSRNFLLGIDKAPRYLIPRRATKGSTARIFHWWVERWLKKRLMRPDVKETFEKLETHNLVMPIRHGARIVLPKSDVEQNDLFPELDS